MDARRKKKSENKQKQCQEQMKTQKNPSKYSLTNEKTAYTEQEYVV